MTSSRPAKQKRNPTIIDVAREANVAVMSVSRVINNHAGVRAKTRARVMEAIERVGYRPNEAARILKGLRSRTIALILPDLSDFFASCFHAVQEVAIQHDYQTLVVATGRDPVVEAQQIEALNHHHVAGLLIVPSDPQGARLAAVKQSGVPVVALDRPLGAVEADAVLVENRQGTDEGVSHLIGHGHSHILCIGFDPEVYTVRERIKGYRQAMRRAGLTQREPVCIASQEEMDSFIARLAQWRRRPSALFSLQRITTIRLIQSLHRAGLRVPADMALIGFDDFELAEVLGTPLTVVSQSPEQIGRTAAQLIFHQIKGEKPKEDEEGGSGGGARIILPTQLIIRRSCGCGS